MSSKEAIRIRPCTDYYNTAEATFPDGHKELLTGWNGERWDEGRPVYRFEAEGIDPTALEENSPEWDCAHEIVDIDR